MARTILSVIVGVIYTIFCIPFCLLFAAVTGRPHILYAFAKLGFRMGLWIGGVRLKCEGDEFIDAHGTFLYIANHQSYVDPAVLFQASPHDLRFMVKKELWKLPLINLGMWLANYVFVDRGSGFKARQAMDTAVQRLRQGQSFLVFAEGTRSRDGRLGSFKRGPFLMAIEAGVPILPVTISGSYQILAPASKSIHPGTIRLVFHPPIDVQGLKSEDAVPLMKQVRQVIASRLPKDGKSGPVEEDGFLEREA